MIRRTETDKECPQCGKSGLMSETDDYPEPKLLGYYCEFCEWNSLDEQNLFPSSKKRTTDSEIVHSEYLNHYTRLVVYEYDIPETERFTFTLELFEPYGTIMDMVKDGVWYETRGAAIAAGMLYNQFGKG